MSGAVKAFTTYTGLGALAKAISGAKPDSPALQTPDALSKTPTAAETAASAATAQLNSERSAASTSTVLSGGQGLLNDPTTTSTLLMGN